MGSPLLALFLVLAPATAQYVAPAVSRALLDPTATYPGSCPCKDAALCEVVAKDRFPDGKELFVFNVAGEPGKLEAWRFYDFSRLTTIALWEFAGESAELYCYAKSLGVRIVIQGSPTADVYASTNETAKAAWARGVAAAAKSYFADGVNFDTEDAIGPRNASARDGLTDCVKRVRALLPPHSVVSYDVGWGPDVDGRFYDFAALAEVADYLVIMAYDMASYIWGACVATPNSPPPQVMWGVKKYLAYAPPEKLVLALPWYGRVYPCVAGTKPEDRYCPIAAAPWRDANCTDANADAVPFFPGVASSRGPRPRPRPAGRLRRRRGPRREERRRRPGRRHAPAELDERRRRQDGHRLPGLVRRRRVARGQVRRGPRRAAPRRRRLDAQHARLRTGAVQRHVQGPQGDARHVDRRLHAALPLRTAETVHAGSVSTTCIFRTA